jgi:hypothetical protein
MTGADCRPSDKRPPETCVDTSLPKPGESCSAFNVPAGWGFQFSPPPGKWLKIDGFNSSYTKFGTENLYVKMIASGYFFGKDLVGQPLKTRTSLPSLVAHPPQKN